MEKEKIEKVLDLGEKKRILEEQLNSVLSVNPDEGKLFFQDYDGPRIDFDGFDKEEKREILTRMAEIVAKKLDAVNKELESL